MSEFETLKKTHKTRWDRQSYKGRVTKRERNKMERLWDRGSTVIQISKYLKRDVRTVIKHLGIGPIDRVVHLLCECLFNPHLSVPPGHIRYPLELNGQDWRLDPITWFYLCVPDLNDDVEPYWEQAAPRFMENLKKTQFWRHYVKLRYEVFQLHKDYEDAVQELSQNDSDLREFWDNLERQRHSYISPSRVPTFPKPNWDEREPSYDREYCDKILNRFSSLIPGVHNRLISLDNMLQQLNDDLIIGGAKVKQP